MASARLEFLIGRISTGDRRAFTQLYDATHEKLFGVALRIIRRRELAEEVLHDAYLRIWDRARTYAPERGSPLAWMVSIVRHRAIDVLRRQRDVAPLDTVTEHAAWTDPEPDALEKAMQSAEARRLLACLNELGGKQRDSILLAFYQGCTHEEVARRIDAPTGTVKSWIRRGLMKLKECLER